MKRILIYLIFFCVLVGIMLAIALKIPIPLATNSDFRVLYFTNLGLIQGINIYDQPAKIQMMSDVYNTHLELDFIPQFAYPPWYALSVFFLGYFSIAQAATLWFEINLLMIFISTWLLTDGWPPRYRLIAFPVVFLFLPVLGTIAIGQYDFPVLLGAALLTYAINRERPGLAAAGIVLLTFKPHIGGLILLAGLIHLLLRRDEFGKRVLKLVAGSGVLLFGIGFLADSAWPVSYAHALMDYSGLSHITSCSECANLSVWLVRGLYFGPGLASASLVSVFLLLVLVVAVTWMRPSLWKASSQWLAIAALITLLASPYLYNYDYVLLLVPFAWLVFPKRAAIDTFLVVLACLAPLIFIGFFGRAGNISLLASTLTVFVLVYLRLNSQVDVPTVAA